MAKFITMLRSVFSTKGHKKTNFIQQFPDNGIQQMRFLLRTAQAQFSFHSLQGTPKKSNPLGKIRYLWNCCRFFRQIYSVYRGRLEPHILRILLQYLVEFKNYNYLNLNVHFLK